MSDMDVKDRAYLWLQLADNASVGKKRRLIEYVGGIESLYNGFPDHAKEVIDTLGESGFAKLSIARDDNYIDKKILDVLSKTAKKVNIITSKINEIDLEKYNKQYSNINIVKNHQFHDRFIIIDKSILYHSGASFKDLGNKCFAINKIEVKTF